MVIGRKIFRWTSSSQTSAVEGLGRKPRKHDSVEGKLKLVLQVSEAKVSRGEDLSERIINTYNKKLRHALETVDSGGARAHSKFGGVPPVDM